MHSGRLGYFLGLADVGTQMSEDFELFLLLFYS